MTILGGGAYTEGAVRREALRSSKIHAQVLSQLLDKVTRWKLWRESRQTCTSD